jgi:hypothetical protein
MAKFFVCYNNGVTAVVSEKVLEKIQWWVETRQEMDQEGKHRDVPLPYPRPIFTFADRPTLWMTGSRRFFEKLKKFLESQGHSFERASFYVPFSNGYEAKYVTAAHCEDESRAMQWLDHAEAEWRFVTSIDEFFQEFGILPELS